jgi:hypothetical protein
MGVLYRLDNSGDGELAKWDPKVKAEVAIAEEIFGNLVKSGERVADISDPHAWPAPLLETFDPDATELMVVPQLQGG